MNKYHEKPYGYSNTASQHFQLLIIRIGGKYLSFLIISFFQGNSCFFCKSILSDYFLKLAKEHTHMFFLFWVKMSNWIDFIILSTKMSILSQHVCRTLQVMSNTFCWITCEAVFGASPEFAESFSAV